MHSKLSKNPSGRRSLWKEELVSSESDTEALAIEFAHKLNLGDCVILEGDLGAGKSTFVHFSLKALGGDEWNGSPTFSIINQYLCRPEAGSESISVIHSDLYRIESLEELDQTGIHPLVADSKSIKFIEWGDRYYASIKSSLSRGAALWFIALRTVGAHERSITIESENF